MAMYEDAACNNPCGAEPMGCVGCEGPSILSSGEVYYHECHMCGAKIGDDQLIEDCCPRCGSDDIG